MKKTIYIILAIVLLALVVFRLKSNKDIVEERIYQYDKEETIYVQVDTLDLKNPTNDMSYSGTFEPNKESKLSAEVQGKVNRIYVDVGASVKKGQTLIQLDNSLLKLQLDAVNVQIEGLEIDVNRYSILAKADAIQGVQLEKTQQALKSTKVQRATISEQIKKSTLKAPFSGVITAKFTEEGAFAAPGMPLILLSDMEKLKFTINISENELNKFKIDETYSIKADAYPDLKLNGKASMIGSKANMGSSFPVQFLLKNDAKTSIKSGMFGKVLFHNDMEKKGIIIPSSSLIDANTSPKVYVVNNGVARLKEISLGSRVGNSVVVSQGLAEGDIIVTGGIINLFDGANVASK